MRKKNSYSRVIQDLENWEKLSKGNIIRLFHHCIENGITSFLLSYSSKTMLTPKIGAAFSESGLSRDEVQLIARLQPEAKSGEGVTSASEEILKILKTDYLDLLIIPAENDPAEMQPALELLKSRGVIFETGLASSRKDEEQLLAKDPAFRAIFRKQNISPAGLKMLNIKESSSTELVEILFLEKEGVGDYSDGVQRMAEKYNLSPGQMILTWIFQHPQMFHAVVQGSTTENIDLAHQALGTRMIDEDWKKFTETI